MKKFNLKKLLSAVMATTIVGTTYSAVTSFAAAPNYDMNLDGVIDTRDSYTLLTFFMEREVEKESSLSPEVYANCEANGDVFGTDGRILPSDVAWILAYTAENDLSGDVNFDGAVTASDAAYTLSFYGRRSVGEINDTDMLSETDFCIKNLCDINEDGSITASDAGEILNIYAEAQTSAD